MIMASKTLRVSLPPLAILAAILTISLVQASFTDLLYENDDNNYERQQEYPDAGHKNYYNKYQNNNYQQQQEYTDASHKNYNKYRNKYRRNSYRNSNNDNYKSPYAGGDSQEYQKNYNNNNNYKGNNYAGGDSQEYLDAHNKARSSVGVGPLSWDESLAQQAYGHASQLAHSGCNLVHLGGPFGENLAMSGGKLSPAEAVQMWMDEKANYGYGGCASGSVCGHYTQIVWRHSTSVGCAKATCDNNGGEVVSCLYNPPGNVVGERPY